MVLVITEPTVSGIHDLQRVTELTTHFSLPTWVCINKYDINEQMTDQIKAYCREHDLMYSGEIPYDVAVIKALVQQTPVVEYAQNSAAKAIKQIWQRVEQEILRF